MDNNYNEPVNDVTVNQANSMEFQILGIKVKYRAPIIFGMLALSVMLNFFLVFKVMRIQKSITDMQGQMYERILEEIKPKMEKINDNIEKANEKLNNSEYEEVSDNGNSDVVN